VVAYSNDVKQHVLGVAEDVLAAHGAVSQPVVEAMATGVKRVAGTTCAIATSGIAGPDGGTPEKPVGTVWMAVSCGDKVVSECMNFAGSRTYIIERATQRALMMLVNLLLARD
jgi:PncC family amidohydrolase